MMMFGHVFGQLAAYAEGQLDERARARVERHLARCSECGAALTDIQAGIRLASSIAHEPMPAAVASHIRAQLRATDVAARKTAPWHLGWRIAAATVAAMVATGVYWQINRPWVQLHAAAAVPNQFEREGRALHDRVKSGAAPLAFRSNDEQALWRWLASEGAPVTSMAITRPDEQRSQFIAEGAAVHTVAGVRASVLSYRIDGRPVTLVLASSRQVPDAPPAGWWSKRVIHRDEPAGINTLTWTVGGGTYVMVSELEGAGQKACLICHTTERFSDAIMRLSKFADGQSSLAHDLHP
jgi:anti-sigma factor RsiW